MKMTNPIHKKILKKLDLLAPKKNIKERLWVQKYLGSNKPTRCIRTGDIVSLSKETVKEYEDEKDILNLVDSLYSKATTFEELHLAGAILNRIPKLKTEVALEKLDSWLNSTHGWAEVDILCQSTWDIDTIISNWTKWKSLLIRFSKDKNIHKRRASLVIPNFLVRYSDDKRLSELAFKNIDLLKKEKEILITKAVSWVLRSLIVNHKKEVSEYLSKNKDSLPKIAVREVTNKLETGVKNKKKRV